MGKERWLHQETDKPTDDAGISTFGRLQHMKHVRHASNTAQ